MPGSSTFLLISWHLLATFLCVRILQFDLYEGHVIDDKSSAFENNEVIKEYKHAKIDYSFLNGSIHMSPSVFQKSIINYGQLNVNVKRKLATNQCLDFIAFGTSVTCAEAAIITPIIPERFEDGWTYQLLEFMNSLWPTCYRGSVLSNHSFVQVRCYGHKFDTNYTEKIEERHGIQETWLESVQLERRKHTSKVLSADIIFVETLEDRHERNVKTTEAFIYSLLTLSSKPSVVYICATFSFENEKQYIWNYFDTDPHVATVARVAEKHDIRVDRRDSPPYLLSTVQHYGVPYISAVDAFGPFISHKSKKWISTVYIGDLKCHLSRMGAKVLALLIFRYFDDVRDSLMHPFSGFQETATETSSYMDVDKIIPKYWEAEQLKDLVTEAHPPLTVTLNSEIDNRATWMVDDLSDIWQQDNWGSSYKHSLLCNTLNVPFRVVIPYNSIHVHFFHQKITIVLGKNIADMGTVHIEIRVFGQNETLSELTVDCLLTASASKSSGSIAGSGSGHVKGGGRGLVDGIRPRNMPMIYNTQSVVSRPNASSRALGREHSKHRHRNLQYSTKELTHKEQMLLNTLAWFDENLHIPKRLGPTDSLEIKFTVVESSPPRAVNNIKLASIHLS